MRKNKILIVEDNLDTVDLLRKRLRADGYDTAEAYDGEEGLEKFAAYEPDLVVLDIMMPKLDGFEVCKRLKEDESTRYIPVLISEGMIIWLSPLIIKSLLREYDHCSA